MKAELSLYAEPAGHGTGMPVQDTVGNDQAGLDGAARDSGGEDARGEADPGGGEGTEEDDGVAAKGKVRSARMLAACGAVRSEKNSRRRPGMELRLPEGRK